MTTNQLTPAEASADAIKKSATRLSDTFVSKGIGDAKFVINCFYNAIIKSLGDPRTDLRVCTTDSWEKVIITCAETGLVPDNEHACLVRYNKKVGDDEWIAEVQLQPMYRGLIKLGKESGNVERISVDVIKENDHIIYEKGTEERLVHKPVFGGRGKTIGAYCVIHYKDASAPEITVRDIDYLMKVKESTAKFDKKTKKPYYTPAWRDHEDEMFMKTVIHRAFKYVTHQTPDLKAALQASLKSDGFLDTEPTVVVENTDADEGAAIEHQPKPAPEPEPTENPAPQEKAKPARQQSKNASAQKAEASPDDQFNDLF